MLIVNGVELATVLGAQTRPGYVGIFVDGDLNEVQVSSFTIQPPPTDAPIQSQPAPSVQTSSSQAGPTGSEVAGASESRETAVTVRGPAPESSASSSSSAVARPLLSLTTVTGVWVCPASLTSRVTSSFGLKPSAVIRARSPRRYDCRSVVIRPLRANAASALKPDEPAASSLRLAPAVSWTFTDQLVLNVPSASALTNHASWPIPASTVPSTCDTCSITLSNGEKPSPEITVTSPARYPSLSVRTTGAVCGPSLRPTPRCDAARFAIRPKAGATPTTMLSSNIRLPTNLVDFNLISLETGLCPLERQRADETVRPCKLQLFGRKRLHIERHAVSA